MIDERGERELLDAAADAVAEGPSFDWVAAEANRALSLPALAILGELKLIAVISALDQAVRGGIPMRAIAPALFFAVIYCFGDL